MAYHMTTGCFTVLPDVVASDVSAGAKTQRAAEPALRPPCQLPAEGAAAAPASSSHGALAAGLATAAAVVAGARRRRHRRSRSSKAVRRRALPGLEQDLLDDDVRLLQEVDGANNMAGVAVSASKAGLPAWRGRATADQDINESKIQRLEGFRGGSVDAREVPDFVDWPSYQIALKDMECLKPDDPALKDFKVLDMTHTVDKASYLSNRWRKLNQGRSLSFLETGGAKLSSCKVAVTILALQMQGLNACRKAVEKKLGEAVETCPVSFVEDFIRENGVDNLTANEFRTIITGVPQREVGDTTESPPDATAYLPFVDAVVGMDKGTAIAVWKIDKSNGTASVEICLGHDCLTEGIVAEGLVLQLVGQKAKDLGLDTLRCKVRFTEDGKYFVPPSFDTLGLSKCPEEAWDRFVQDFADEEKELKDRLAVNDGPTSDPFAGPPEPPQEVVYGLHLWLMVRGLEHLLPACNEWCEEMGAATMEEVVESREDLAEALADKIRPEERQKLVERNY
eukprot:TRINITY_DN74468_c0_g1_i1.p1 TRINITY_DN74468_c0_g1~~TRINITY_DN74468_c0_g1_i1.p1  ORF type:complete len:525 (+),score=148.20 TRINITY_DN74468_c0_g1_i1:51-1577(+)